MSCTVMYQPYAMSYSCDRPSGSDKKAFKFPQAPSPPESCHSDNSSYNSPGPVLPASNSAGLSVGSSGRRAGSPVIGGRSSSSASTSEPPLAHHVTSHRAQYISANCVVFVHYSGDVSRVLEEHFNRSLCSNPDKQNWPKGSSLEHRNFPPSFWNSNYQAAKPLPSYGAPDFYGAAVDYGPPLPTLAHHHQSDPWHYPLPPQSYHRPAELSYPPIPSTSRFNAAQYGSLFLAGAAAAGSSAGRFPGMPPPSSCGVKGDNGAWGGSRYHHESLSELSHLADYSAAAAAHYSNMTAGFETSVQDSSKDLYWI